MEELLHDLVVLLTQEAAEYRQLLALLEDEERALIHGESGRVAELTKRKETLALELKVLEEARATLMDRLAAHLAMPVESVTLTGLLDLAPVTLTSSLHELRDELSDLMGRLFEANRRNGFLLERSLAHVRGALALLTSLVTHPPTYESTGQLFGSGSSVTIFDHRV
jgi:flagellar biosynthesis/type III secretory pathway chaperone